MIRLISHCHTHHSFDSSMKVTSIIEEAKKYNVNVIIINDHDVFTLDKSELSMFNTNDITILAGIEFTTAEGVHVIGVHENIKSIEEAPFFYSLEELIHTFKLLGAKVIFPHPYHATGVYGNKNVTSQNFEVAIKNGDAFETDNYRYGLTPVSIISKIIQINPSIIQLIGSDAHTKKEVTAFINEYDIEIGTTIQSVLHSIFSRQPLHLRIKKRSKLYFNFKKFQKTTYYQFVINIVSANNRKKIKSFIKFGK